MSTFAESFAKVAQVDPEAWENYVKALARVTEIALSIEGGREIEGEVESGKKAAILLLKQCYNAELMDWDEYSTHRKYVNNSEAGGFGLVRLVYDGLMGQRGRSAAEVNSTVGISGTLFEWYEANK